MKERDAGGSSMRQRWLEGGLVVALLAIVGCSSDQFGSPAPPPAAPASDASASSPLQPPPPPPPESLAQGTATVAESSTVVQQQGEDTKPEIAMESPIASPQTSAEVAPPTGAASVHLSTGVALAQTGLDGTLMSFSVDYQFVAGQADATTAYLWVIERAKGDPVRQPVRLSSQGALQILVPTWRPEDGPFQTHLEDARGNRLSESVSLQ